MKYSELWWAAGFFDGEGSAGWHGNHPFIEVVQTSPDPLERLQRILGGKVYGPYSNGERGRLPRWRWVASATRSEAKRILNLLKPRVSSVKRKQIEKVFAKLETNPLKVGLQAPVCEKGGHPWTPENTGIKRSTGKRYCRTCNLAYRKEYRQRRNLLYARRKMGIRSR